MLCALTAAQIRSAEPTASLRGRFELRRTNSARSATARRLAWPRAAFATLTPLTVSQPSSPTASGAAVPNSSNTWIGDLRAGFLVFLIALPLCLGIAMASGFPPVAGVMTAIVGGLVVTPLGSAPLTIKGPAAGLIVIAIGAVTELGQGDIAVGYPRALAVGVVAAAIQILFALMRTATIGIAMSPSVVHGMLAAIGVIIFSKQAHTVVGVAPQAKTPLGLLAEIPHSIANANPEILTLGGLALVVLFGWPLLRTSWSKLVPAPLIVLAIAVPLGMYFDLPHSHDYIFLSGHYHVGPEFLVKLPGSLLDAVRYPDFSVITSATSIRYIVMFALVGTIESTLSVLAVDAMDPAKRASNLNRDLLALGVGNLVSSAIGGLPMISEIVRSRANIDAGARSSKANFVHGALLLAFVAAAPGLLQTIPLAALGAMLVYTGTRLASPKEFSHSWHLGLDQFLIFVTTLVVTLAVDILVGVGVGLLLKLLLHWMRGADPIKLFRPKILDQRNGDTLSVAIHGAAAFPSLLGLRKRLSQLAPDVRNVIVDLRESVLVDHTFLARVEAMSNELPNVRVEVLVHEQMKSASGHAQATRWRARS